MYIVDCVKNVSSILNSESLLTLYYWLVYFHINQLIAIRGDASENNIKPIRIVVDKILRMILHVKQDNYNI